MPSGDPTEDAKERVGSTLRGKWRLDSLLGVGGMAAVYAATHRNGMRGAVKMLHAEYARDPQLRERFLKEGYFANKLDHAGAVRVLDDDVAEDDSAFIVMELLEGEPLDVRALAAGGRVPVRDAMLLADQLLDVLAAAHDKGIVHRDVKPENLFLTRDGILKILDFGIAQLRQGRARSTKQTLAGQPLGTPAYMAPEQARGKWELVDARSDLWSVGATFFSLASGRLVHEEDTLEETLAATFTRPARSLASVAPDVPAAFVAWVDKALALDKSDRWANAREMRAALHEVYHSVVGQPMPEAPTASAASSKRLPLVVPLTVGGHAHGPGAPTPAPLAADTEKQASLFRTWKPVAAIAALGAIAVAITFVVRERPPSSASTIAPPSAPSPVPTPSVVTPSTPSTSPTLEIDAASAATAATIELELPATPPPASRRPRIPPRTKPTPSAAASVDMNKRTWQ